MKKIIVRILNVKIINIVILGIYSLCKAIFPIKYLKIFHRLPVIKKVRIHQDGFNIFYMISDGKDTIAKSIYWEGLRAYEPRTLRLLTHLLKESNSFYDIGANTGLFSLLAASSDNINNVYSFEPLDIAYNLFQSNISINEINKITLHKIALSNFNGESIFNVNKTDSDIPLGASLRNDVIENEIAESIKVKALMLDTFINENNIASMDLLKIDTEGTEDLVIQGGLESIDRFRPVMICEVLSHTKTEDKIHALLDAKKYEYFFVNDEILEKVEKLKGDPYIVSNYLLIPEEKSSILLKDFKIKQVKEKIFH